METVRGASQTLQWIMIMYGMNNDSVVSPTVVVILGSLAWVLALMDVGIDAAIPRRRRVDQD